MDTGETREHAASKGTAVFLELLVTGFIALVLFGFFIKFLFF